MTHQRLDEYLDQLSRVEDVRDKLPPGDRRGEVDKVAKRIREMICEADGAIGQGRNVENQLARIRNLINLILK